MFLGLDSFVINEISTLCKFTITLAILFFILWIILFIVKFIAIKIWERQGTDDEKSFVKSLIYNMDKFSDVMSNKQKKTEVVNSVRELFSWRGIRVPAFIVGWIIDMEVSSIRKLQKMSKKDCNLHPDNCPKCNPCNDENTAK